jgi:hypothetical protein
MRKLPSLVPTVGIDADAFDLEVRALHADGGRPSAYKENGEPVRLDTWWWTMVFKTNKYPINITRVIKAVISIFHGPRSNPLSVSWVTSLMRSLGE